MPRPKIRSREDLAALEQERHRRAVARDHLLDSAFESQRKFIEDPARWKAAQCTRRAGKSYGMGLYMVRTALQNPGCTVLYLGKSRESAKRIIVRHILLEIFRRFGLDVTANMTDLSFTFPNGSIIYVGAADSSDKEHAKLLGQKYKLVVIDEAAEWKTDLINLIYSTLKAGMVDERGTMCLIGVPGNIRGPFFDITTRRKDSKTGQVLWPNWSVHKWSAKDNPHTAVQWEEELEEEKAKNPLFLESAIYKQQFLGEWVTDPDAHCYRFKEELNRCTAMAAPAKEYHYVMGIDLGWKDPTAIVVCAYREEEHKLYVVYAFKQSEMLLDEIATKVRDIAKEFDIDRYIVDSANRQVIEEFRQRYAIPLEAAEKTRKYDFINMASHDLQMGNVKVVGTHADDLVEEWKGLVWDRTGVLPKEHSSCDNHCADAYLYAWRACFAFTFKSASVPEVKRNTPEWVTQWEQKLALRLSRNDDDPIAALDEFFNS